MRSLLVVMGLAAACGSSSAALLRDADREALIERLDALKNAALEQTDARYRAGFSAYNDAMGAGESALDLYLKCVEKVEYQDLKRKEGDFRDWKRKEDERLSKPGFKLALQHQLRWLSLTLQASSEKADRSKLVPVAKEAMEGVFRDIALMKEQQAILKIPVTGTVFARAYGVTAVKVEKWPLTPVDVANIYDQIIMPPLRNPRDVPELQQAWIRRIQQEGLIVEYWTSKGKDDNKPKDGRIGMADTEGRSPEFEKFLIETVPNLQWQMEVDLFKAGDEAAASLRMLQHIEKFQAFPSCKDWTDQFRALLSPPKETAKTEPAPAPAPGN